MPHKSHQRIKSIKPNTTRLGKNLAWLRPFHHGNMVRLGSDCDGGYVVPQDKISEIDGVLSFGIDQNWTFEAYLRSIRPEITLHAYDHTIHERQFYRDARTAWLRLFGLRGSWRQVQEKAQKLKSFRKTFFGGACHFREKISDRVSGSGQADLSTAFQRMGACRNILMKMDIEGDEYRVLPDLILHARKIAVLVIEFHDTSVYRLTFRSCILALRNHFYLAHLHANNAGGLAKDGLPELLELTFVRGRPRSKQKIQSLPIQGLDQPNLPTRSDFKLRWI